MMQRRKFEIETKRPAPVAGDIHQDIEPTLPSVNFIKPEYFHDLPLLELRYIVNFRKIEDIRIKIRKVNYRYST